MSKNFFTNYFQFMQEGMNSVNYADLQKAAETIRSVSKSGNKLIIDGNDGSAVTASHVSVDLTRNANVRAVNFNEADLLTCFSNDYGYERWIEKVLEFIQIWEIR